MTAAESSVIKNSIVALNTPISWWNLRLETLNSSFAALNLSISSSSLAKARAVRMPESDDSMPTLMAAVFCFSPREAAVILLRRDMMTAMNTGRMHATTSASRHSMENRMASAPTIVSVEMSRSSGPWWASSVISKRSLVSLLMSWPVRLWSKKLTSSSCTCVKRSRRISASTRMPNVCPQ